VDATHEAADSGLLSPELAAGTSRVKGVKQLGFRLSLFRVAQAQAEPNMNIIDSLLKSKCFLSRRGAENPSPEPFVGRHHKVYPGVGADIVMESLHSLTRIGQFLNECDRLFYKRGCEEHSSTSAGSAVLVRGIQSLVR